MKTAPVFFIVLIAGLLLIPVATSGQASGPTDPILTSAEEAQRDGHLADAEKTLSDAIRQSEESDPQNPQLPQYREQLVFVLHEEGRITEAEKVASEAVREAEKAGPDTPEVAHALEQLAWLVSDKGELSKALMLYQRGLEIDQNVFGPQDRTVIIDLVSVGNVLMLENKNDESEKVFKQALDIARMNSSLSKEDHFIVVSHMAVLYIREKRLLDAEQVLLEGTKDCPQATKESACAPLLYFLAEVYELEGRTAEASKLTAPNSSEPPIIRTLQAEAAQYNRNGQYPEAEEATRRAINSIEQNTAGKTGANVDLSFQYHMLGDELHEEGRDDEAATAYEKAIDLALNDALASHSTGTDGAGNSVFGFVTEDFDDLIEACRSMDRLSDAERVIKNVIDLQEKAMGADHPSMVPTLIALANLYKEEGDTEKPKYTDALPLYQRALEIREASVGQNDPRLTDVLAPYSDLLRKMHQDSKASAVQARIDALETKDERNPPQNRQP